MSAGAGRPAKLWDLLAGQSALAALDDPLRRTVWAVYAARYGLDHLQARVLACTEYLTVVGAQPSTVQIAAAAVLTPSLAREVLEDLAEAGLLHLTTLTRAGDGVWERVW